MRKDVIYDGIGFFFRFFYCVFMLLSTDYLSKIVLQTFAIF